MVKGDVNKPKGKTSAYAFFVQTCRDEHKRKSPDVPVNFSEFSKKCSERWKSLNASEKTKFEDMAKVDKARYDKEMKNYVPPKGVGKTGRKKKDPNAPKRPPSAFFIFCSEYRPTVKSENPSLTIGEIAKKLGELWSKQSTKDRAPYEQKAVKLREKYEKQNLFKHSKPIHKTTPEKSHSFLGERVVSRRSDIVFILIIFSHQAVQDKTSMTVKEM
ncbi:high mobility group B2-like protein [Labeo rohita]|uniref:High mobility group protein B2 n=1 Tax=Labeo rohita TaxID=84645 RepID=A0A498LMZ7_LABRO|nr:high mobility group B2-like protein [Labeo rohita]